MKHFLKKVLRSKTNSVILTFARHEIFSIQQGIEFFFFFILESFRMCLIESAEVRSSVFVGDGEEEKRDGRPAHPAGVALLLLRYYLWRGTDGRAVASRRRSHTTIAATLSLLFLVFFPLRKLFS